MADPKSLSSREDEAHVVSVETQNRLTAARAAMRTVVSMVLLLGSPAALFLLYKVALLWTP